MPRIRAALVAGACLAAVLMPAHDASAGARVFSNCAAMNKVYKHGVGRTGAHDKTSGKPVTTFKRSNALYKANHKRDRDKDGVACEKR